MRRRDDDAAPPRLELAVDDARMILQALQEAAGWIGGNAGSAAVGEKGWALAERTAEATMPLRYALRVVDTVPEPQRELYWQRPGGDGSAVAT